MGFIQDFFGKTARDDLASGKAQADADLTGGYKTGRADIQSGIDRLDPIAQGGQSAYARLLNSLGVNGAGAQGGVESEYMADPIQNQLMDRITKANTRRFTSMMPGSAGNNSGAATQSLTNSLLANWKQYQDQLGGAAAPGIAATGQQAGFNKDQGDMAYGYGATQAGNDINYANARSQASQLGVNSLMKILGLGTQVATAVMKGGGGGGGGGGGA
jgi:hypothetical protein